MKYKLYGLLTVLSTCAMVAVAVLILQKDDIKKDRYLQHIDAPVKEECLHGEDRFCTHLPLVVIDTNGVEIPGKAYHDSDGTDSFMLGPNGEDEIAGKVLIYDNDSRNNHLDDEPKVDSSMLIHVRGNSSRFFDKPGYSIRLTDEDGKQNNVSVMGMGKHHEWVLHGPYLDKTLIRNYMWYNIAGQIMDYAPEVRFCEVFVNGEYRGLYVMCESITAGSDRLQLKVNKKDNTFTGYLLRLDRGSENEYKNLDNFSNYTYRITSTVDCVYPGLSNLNDELKKSITDDFSYFEKIIYSYDYNDEKYGYRTLIDVDNFVDYFIINELTCNYDAGAFSTYIYKDLDGRFKLCVWDFNNCCDNYMEQAISYRDFGLVNRAWFKMLIKDEYFVEKIIDRYKELRKDILSEESLLSFIDDTITYLGDSVDRNYEVWDYIFESHDLDNVLIPFDRNPDNYDEAVQDLKDFLIRRGEWLDKNIESLRQYCAGSKNKIYDANAN